MGIDSMEFREAAIDYVLAKAERSAGIVTRADLESFSFRGTSVRLIAPTQGICNPKVLDATISILHSPRGPYDDGTPENGTWDYAYEGETTERSNVKLRRAMELQLPVIYLDKLADGIFSPIAPVFVTGDRPQDLRFEITVGDIVDLGTPSADTVVERKYRETLVKQRIHQPQFRTKVLYAYRSRCAICELPEESLLDAAHIRPDKDKLDGGPVVQNGLALCSIHHRAFDRMVIGIDPDYGLHVRPDIAKIVDGPVLANAVQRLEGQVLANVPRGQKAPDQHRLEKTFKEFLTASGIG